MAENRLARELQTREIEAREESWKPPETLPFPAPQEGYAFRYIRTALMGQADAPNTASKFREGWVPVKAVDHPEMMTYVDPNSRFKDNVEIGGLLLCKASAKMVAQRNAHYSNVARSQIEAVDNSFMKTNDPRMPLFNERKSTTTFGRGAV